MGFKVEFNSILRTDDFQNVEEGKEYSFEKEGNRIYFDNIQIWLIKNDWTALAEIQITSQTRKKIKLSDHLKFFMFTLRKNKKFSQQFLNECMDGNDYPNVNA